MDSQPNVVTFEPDALKVIVRHFVRDLLCSIIDHGILV